MVPLIVVDQNRCDSLLANLDDGMAFLVHEVMGLMKKETRENYSISKNVLNELKEIAASKVGNGQLTGCRIDMTDAYNAYYSSYTNGDAFYVEIVQQLVDKGYSVIYKDNLQANQKYLVFRSRVDFGIKNVSAQGWINVSKTDKYGNYTSDSMTVSMVTDFEKLGLVPMPSRIEDISDRDAIVIRAMTIAVLVIEVNTSVYNLTEMIRYLNGGLNGYFR